MELNLTEVFLIIVLQSIEMLQIQDKASLWGRLNEFHICHFLASFPLVSISGESHCLGDAGSARRPSRLKELESWNGTMGTFAITSD